MRAGRHLGHAALAVAALIALPGTRAARAGAHDALLYVASTASNTVAIFPRSDSRRKIGEITKGIDKPGAMTTDLAGTLYVANGNNTITAYPVGAASPSLTYSQGINGPAYLATGPDGSLYVSNDGASTVVQFLPGSTTAARTIPFKQQPGGIAVNDKGDLFVVTGTDILLLHPDENHGSSLGFTLPENGLDLAIDRRGDFLVNLPDFGVLRYARARPHAQTGRYGFLYTQQGAFALSPDDRGLYLVDSTDGRVVQIAYPDINFANVIDGLGSEVGGVAVTPKPNP